MAPQPRGWRRSSIPTRFCEWRCKTSRSTKARRTGGRTPPPPPQPADTKATFEQTQAAENITRQELTDNVEQRIQSAQALMNQNQPEAAMNALRLTLNVIRSATDVSEDVRAKLESRVQAQLMATAQAEERIVAERAERTRLDSAAEQRTRTIDLLQRDKQTIEAMMIQFDLLIKEGVYNVLYSGGMGNIVTTSAPFGEAQAAGAAGLCPSARRAASL